MGVCGRQAGVLVKMESTYGAGLLSWANVSYAQLGSICIADERCVYDWISVCPTLSLPPPYKVPVVDVSDRSYQMGQAVHKLC